MHLRGKGPAPLAQPMRTLVHWWRDVSIARKLYLVVGIMAVLIAGELITLRFAMHTLSAVRAFVGGEGLWSKAQKNAVFSLQRYAITHDERDYRGFLEYLSVTDGDHAARLELMKPRFDPEVVRQGFLQGRIDAEDIPPMIDLLRRFSQVSYLARAIDQWTRADGMVIELKAIGAEFHTAVGNAERDPDRLLTLLTRMQQINVELTSVEQEFSNALGEGSRWLERIVMTLLFAAALTVESIGLGLTVLTSRAISRGLAALNDTARRIGHGDFDSTVVPLSRDEIGQLAVSVNEMGAMLRKSYTELEARVQERTAELGRMVEQNGALYEKTKAALDTRDEFLSVASHELKTPLAALSLQLQSLARALHRPEPQKDVPKLTMTAERCVGQARRLAHLIEELLDLTRIKQGRLELHSEKVDLSSIAADVVAQLGIEADRAGSTLTLEAPAPVTVVADPTRVFQVVTNLVSNAIKYGDGKPIKIAVRTEAGGAQVDVQDRGPGVAPEDRERIFERFERANSDHTIKGLGLGLYISRQLVQAHGGSLGVQNDDMGGSRFTMTLPAAGA